MENPKKILIVAGEASGDTHAANLVKELKKILPGGVSFFGLGGPKMKEQGVEISCDLTGFAVVGFWEVLKNLDRFRNIFRDLLKQLDERKPDLAILVDYPGFNLRLAEELHKRKIPVSYYISPQIWAWGGKRINLIRKVVRRMIVLFKFEEKLYQDRGVPVTFSGNPLVDSVKPSAGKNEYLLDHGLKTGILTLALLPGSRKREVMTLLPVMMECAKIINGYFFKRVQFIVLRAPSVPEAVFRQIIRDHELPLKIVTGSTYDGIAASDFAIVCSGTATLETAILATPMVILYKTSFLTWLFIRMMIKIPYIGLVNVVKGRKICEEFIQYQADPEKICDYVMPLLHDKDKLARIKLELLTVKPLLGEPGADRRAAQALADLLKNTG